MTWPADELPRFKASVLSEGFTVGSARVHPVGYVYDRACCHRIVARTRPLLELAARSEAERAAAILEAGGELPPELLGDLPHGRSRYKERGCRCDACRAAAAEYRRSLRDWMRAAT